MTALSVLDLVMIGEGKDLATAINESRELAITAEQHGFRRYWIAEHHNMPGIGSAATSLIIAQLAGATHTIRVGSGGIMLPNHAPLVIAEQFGTLDALYPGRIDLGVGRAPGGGGATVRALRGLTPERDFNQDVVEVMDYLADNHRRPVHAVPEPHEVPLWILGSSLHGADLAAKLGLPYAFASHFAPRFLMQAIAHYRNNFKPSPQLAKPYVMAGVNLFLGDTNEEAEYLASSHQRWMLDLHMGRPGLLQPPVENFIPSLSSPERQMLNQVMAFTAAGDKKRVSMWLREVIANTDVDELIIDSRIYDPRARQQSHILAAEAIQDIAGVS